MTTAQTAAVAEIVTFRLAPAITEDAFLAAAAATEPFVRAAPGFRKRRLSKAEDGRWTDYVEWASRATAEAAGQAIMAEPAAAPFLKAIDMSTVSMRHETIQWQME